MKSEHQTLTSLRSAYHAKANEINQLMDDLQMELKFHDEDCFSMRPAAARVRELDEVKDKLARIIDRLHHARELEIARRSAK